jgi:hypothetical protein
MLTLTKETGAGLANANSYADVVDGSAYHDGHLYATAWTGATAGNQAAALVMATRIIDAMFRFNGFKRITTQALQWPRRQCPDRDDSDGVVPGLLLVRGGFVDETTVPAAVVAATCELARELLVSDLTASPAGDGLKAIRIEGAMKLDFDPKGKPPVVPRLVQQMLGKLGEYAGASSGTVRLVRV